MTVNHQVRRSKETKSKPKRPPTPDSSEDDEFDICDNEQLDEFERDVGLSLIPSLLNQLAKLNKVCGACP